MSRYTIARGGETEPGLVLIVDAKEGIVVARSSEAALSHVESLVKAANMAEQLLVQLAGCGVAAMGGIKPDQLAPPGSYGWSPAYQDVVKLRCHAEDASQVLDEAGIPVDPVCPEKGLNLGERVAHLKLRSEVNASNAATLTQEVARLAPKLLPDLPDP